MITLSEFFCLIYFLSSPLTLKYVNNKKQGLRNVLVSVHCLINHCDNMKEE